MMPHTNKLSLQLLVLAIVAIWGYSWVLMKVSLEYMGPFTFSLLRFAVGTFTLFLILFILRNPLPKKERLFDLFLLGLLQTTFVFLLVMYGMRFVEAGKSSVILYSMPLWSSLFAKIFLNEQVTSKKWLGISIGTVGLLFIIGWDVFLTQNLNVVFGEVLIVLAAVSWGMANIFHQKKFKNEDKIQVTTFQMFFGTLGIFLATLLIDSEKPLALTPMSIYTILFTGVLASAFCFSVWFYLLTKVNIVTVTISSLLVPVFGLLFSWILLGEEMNTQMIIGSVLILIGILITKELRLPRFIRDH
ncbi:DMT family transporter [Bacillus tianshenii]|nr:DMT family transporter [Bacillus tianshenii]